MIILKTGCMFFISSDENNSPAISLPRSRAERTGDLSTGMPLDFKENLRSPLNGGVIFTYSGYEEEFYFSLAAQLAALNNRIKAVAAAPLVIFDSSELSENTNITFIWR